MNRKERLEEFVKLTLELEDMVNRVRAQSTHLRVRARQLLQEEDSYDHLHPLYNPKQKHNVEKKGMWIQI